MAILKIPITVIKLNYKLILCLLIFSLCFSCFLGYYSVKAKEKEGIPLPIIMYHSVLKSNNGDFIVTPDTLEKDLQYIQEHGYTTITMAQLIAYVYEDQPLPDKPILITFDDGHYNNLGYAVPLLQKYQMKAVVSIVGGYTDTYSKTGETNLNYSYLRWKDVDHLIDEGTIEFQNHTYHLHDLKNGRKGCMKKYAESVEHYKEVLKEDLSGLQEKFQQETNYLPTTFTYPFGAISKESTDIIKELGFKASLSCASGINYITKDPNCLYLLRRNNRTNSANRETFFHKILQ